MGWREFLFGEQKATAETVEHKAAAVQLPPQLFWLDGNPYRADLPANSDAIGPSRAFAVSALVYACMTLIASKTTEAPLWIAEEDADGNVTWLPSNATHPLAALLEQPNPDQEMSDLIETVVLYYLMGDTLLVLNRDRATRVASVYAFDTDAFTVKPGVVDGVARMYGEFTVTDAGGTQRTFGPDDVIYLRPPGGVSAVDAALSSIRLGTELRSAVKSSLRKAMRPGSVTTTNGTLSPESFAQLKAQLTGFYGGGDNVGNNLVLDGPELKWQSIPVNLKDLDLGPLDDATETAICQAFHVPPEIVRAHVALKHNGGLADAIKPAQALYYDQAQFPLWNKLERAFTRSLLRPIDANALRYIRFVTDDVRALQPDLVSDANVAKALTGVARLDEQRAMVHLPPLGGAEGEAIAPAAGTGQAPNDGLTRPQEPTKSFRPALSTKAGRLASDAERAAYWADFYTKAQSRVPRFERGARRLFRDEKAGVLAVLRGAQRKGAPMALERKDDAGGTAERLTDAEIALILATEAPYLDAAELQIAADYAANGPYAQAWADAFGTLLTVTMEAAAKEFVAGVGVTFSMNDPALLQAIADRAAALVQHVTETTKAAITDAIATGKADGLTIEQIAARVEDQAFGAIAKARAQAIANTEVVGAINDAKWTAATAPHLGGLFQSKRWIHTRRPGDRKYHDAHEYEGDHGGWVPIAYAYTAQNGTKFARPFAPGLPASEVVHCGCTLAFSDVAPAQAQEEG